MSKPVNPGEQARYWGPPIEPSSSEGIFEIEGEAHAVEGLEETRSSAAGRVDNIQSQIALQEKFIGQAQCPEGENCGLSVDVRTASDRYPSEVIFNCPNCKDGCGRVALIAAERTEARLKMAAISLDAELRRLEVILTAGFEYPN
jgi:hypothetical protein